MAIVIATFLVLILLGVPIAFALGLSAAAFFAWGDPRFLPMLAQRFYGGLDSYVLLAIPFFVLAGELINACGVTQRLVAFSNLLVGRVRGGLAHVNVVSSFFFAGITGAAVSDVSALGSIFVPAMRKRGYPGDFSAAITATSSIMGALIPPSTVLLLYGALTGTSIAALFAASIVPGVFVGLTDMIIIHILAEKRKFPKEAVSYS